MPYPLTGSRGSRAPTDAKSNLPPNPLLLLIHQIKQLALRHVAQTYSDEEIRDIRDQFALMDKDGTGTLSLDEMIEALQNMQVSSLAEIVLSPRVELPLTASISFCV